MDNTTPRICDPLRNGDWFRKKERARCHLWRRLFDQIIQSCWVFPNPWKGFRKDRWQKPWTSGVVSSTTINCSCKQASQSSSPDFFVWSWWWALFLQFCCKDLTTMKSPGFLDGTFDLLTQHLDVIKIARTSSKHNLASPRNCHSLGNS